MKTNYIDINTPGLIKRDGYYEIEEDVSSEKDKKIHIFLDKPLKVKKISTICGLKTENSLYADTAYFIGECYIGGDLLVGSSMVIYKKGTIFKNSKLTVSGNFRNSKKCTMLVKDEKSMKVEGEIKYDVSEEELEHYFEKIAKRKR